MSAIPKVREDDPEDVSWALSTAATQFARGDRQEAVKWLRRAAESAAEAGRDARALELARAAAELAASTLTTSSRPTAKPAPAPPRPATQGKARPVSPVPPKNTQRRPPVKAAKAHEPDESHTDPHIVPPPASPDETSRLPSVPADAWPTEGDGTKLDALGQVFGQERTRVGALPYRPPPEAQVELRASQAVHVIVWRAPDGSLRIAPKGADVSAVTIDALLVAPSPDVDLVAWFGSH